jgi:hypothetical protein
VQVRLSYDLTGNGSWERVETYRYFATDPVPGYEHYTQAAGLQSSSGTLGNLANVTVKVEVWSAIGGSPSTLGLGNLSVVTRPYSCPVRTDPPPRAAGRTPTGGAGA